MNQIKSIFVSLRSLHVNHSLLQQAYLQVWPFLGIPFRKPFLLRVFFFAAWCVLKKISPFARCILRVTMLIYGLASKQSTDLISLPLPHCHVLQPLCSAAFSFFHYANTIVSNPSSELPLGDSTGMTTFIKDKSRTLALSGRKL